MFVELLVNSAQAAVTLPSVDSAQNIGQLIVSIFNFAMAIVAFAIFVQFIHAGLIYLMAAGNMTEYGKAKTIMQNALLGALLLMSSYLILNVINPDLLRTDIFNLDEIAKQIKKPSGGVDRIATNPKEEQLKNIGVNWGASDVSQINEKTIFFLSQVKNFCSCALVIGGYQHSTGGDSFSLSPHDKVYDFIKDNAEKINQSVGKIGDDDVLYETWESLNGHIYETTKVITNSSNKPVGNLIRIPK